MEGTRGRVPLSLSVPTVVSLFGVQLSKAMGADAVVSELLPLFVRMLKVGRGPGTPAPRGRARDMGGFEGGGGGG